MRWSQVVTTCLRRLAEIDKTLLIHDSALREIVQKLRPLLEPPPQPPKPEIGFLIKPHHKATHSTMTSQTLSYHSRFTFHVSLITLHVSCFPQPQRGPQRGFTYQPSGC